MKFRVAKREMRNQGLPIIAINYCGLGNFMNMFEPFAFSSGKYGWCCDYYQFNNAIISTGYSPIGIEPDEKAVEKCKNAGNQVYYDNQLKYEQKVAQATKVVDNFISEVISQNIKKK